MDDQTVLLLNEVVKNAEMGKNTVTQLLGITDDERLKIHLNRQLATYEDLSKRAMQCWPWRANRPKARMLLQS